MNLITKQKAFAKLLPRLIDKAHELGFEVTMGEVWRSPEEAKRLSQLKMGIRNSLHCEKLAVDLNLFKDGLFLSRTADHKQLGEWWEKQSTDLLNCCWGGRWGDGNHYSIEHNGIK